MTQVHTAQTDVLIVSSVRHKVKVKVVCIETLFAYVLLMYCQSDNIGKTKK